MHPQAIAGVIADELRQQQELYRVLQLSPFHDHPRTTSNEEWEQALETAYQQGKASHVHALAPAAMVHRCYTVYQSCVYEAIAGEQQVELAPKRLLLHGNLEESHFELHLSAKKQLPADDPELALYREHASACQFSEPEQSLYKARIQLDQAIETHLSHALAEDIKHYAEMAPADFSTLAHHMAERCLQEIGKMILGALGTMWPVYATFLGVLHWNGQGYEVAFSPSSSLVDMLEISAMRSARTRREEVA